MTCTAQVVRVERELLAACMTCPLCNKLLREATTISECLHTFCRKCIYDKLTEEEVDFCPICGIDLGCVPVEKLRPDHNLQDVRATIFPFKRRKVKAPEVMPSNSLPVRRKERSLSSLVVSTPRVATRTSLTGRRTKAFARRTAAVRGASSTIDGFIKKEGNNAENHAGSSSPPESLSNMTQNGRQSYSVAEPSNHIVNKDTQNGVESFVDKTEFWRPLNCLVEAANRTKSLKFYPAKSEQTNGHVDEENIHKTKVRKHPHKSRVQDEKSQNITPSPALTKRRLQRICQKKDAVPLDLSTSAQALLDAAPVRHEKRIGPIWFSLVASSNQEGDAPLPQISACYLRIKDGNIPISFIQKYLAKKLELKSEAEVEIMCRGQTVSPTFPLHKLVDLWLYTGSSQKVQASVGTSARDFVMVLAYGRKNPVTWLGSPS